MSTNKELIEQLKKLNSALEDYLDNMDMDSADDEEDTDTPKAKKKEAKEE